MSRTIHGLSHKAIRHMRQKPAALPVYWCYVARMNNEGVSWPSLRGLARDTGWNKDSCAEGRRWLLERGALEIVAAYIRPEWRGLDAADKSRRLNLDKSEYYRPTGHFTAEDGSRFWLLYNGGDETSDLDEKTPDVRRGRPSARSTIGAVDHRRGRTELNSRSELDSTTELNSHKDAPGGASKPKPLKGYEDIPHPTRTAIIEAWLKSLSAPPVNGNAYANTNHHKLAAALARAGYTADDVRRYVTAMQTDNFWRDKALKLKNVADNLPAWIRVHPAAEPAPLPDGPDTGPRPLPLADILRKVN